MDKTEALAENIKLVQGRIAAAARRAGRSPDEISLVAVSKTMPATLVAEAARLGLTIFGENRVQEAGKKIPLVRELFEGRLIPKWHLVGHLQTNKVREALASFDVIQSVDSLRLAERIEAEATRAGRTVSILLEVNVARETAKHGFLPEELPAAAARIAQQPHLTVQGLMTVAPMVTDKEEVRWVFRGLRELRDALRELFPAVDWHCLSMGMSEDYEVAIAEGATIVRVGRAIFGERHSNPNP